MNPIEILSIRLKMTLTLKLNSIDVDTNSMRFN